MGTPTDDTATRRYEDYVFLGRTTTPKTPRGYDAELASLRYAHQLFREGREKFRGYGPLEKVVPRDVIDKHHVMLKAALGRAHDARVVEILCSGYFWLRLPDARQATYLTLLLSDSGKWVVFVGSRVNQLHVVDSVDELVSLLFNDLAVLGALQHTRGVIVDYHRIGWHLEAMMQQSARIKRKELQQDKKRLKRLRDSRARMSLPSY